MTGRQQTIIEAAARDVPPAQSGSFRKYVEDVLRCCREVDDEDVRRAVSMALARYGEPRA
jgi:hypothetical protein